MQREVQETERFTAVSEAGKEFTVVEMTTFTKFQPASRAAQWLRGGSEYVLSDGSDVSPLGEDTFKILGNDLIIRRAQK
ncbi:MAG: hypothetical protein GC191_11430 [Azospirillum sp.]|nr:hypothetical protein [Azospirillum sp.]